MNDLLSDCPSCKIVNAKSPNELAEAINWATVHQKQIREDAQGYRKVAFERFDLRNLVRNTEQVYRSFWEEM